MLPAGSSSARWRPVVGDQRRAFQRLLHAQVDVDVKAQTKDGVITLTGHVRTWAEHDAVVAAASMAIGVIDVRDDLQVTG
jgi:BON domain